MLEKFRLVSATLNIFMIWPWLVNLRRLWLCEKARKFDVNGGDID